MRCRLITSWSGSTFQGLGCSPIKVVRELGSKRRKLLATLQSDLLEKFASYRRTPFILLPNRKKDNPEGSQKIILCQFEHP